MCKSSSTFTIFVYIFHVLSCISCIITCNTSETRNCEVLVAINGSALRPRNKQLIATLAFSRTDAFRRGLDRLFKFVRLEYGQEGFQSEQWSINLLLIKQNTDYICKPIVGPTHYLSVLHSLSQFR